MFISQCNTGLTESRFKKPDTSKIAGKRQASQHRTRTFGVGAWGWRSLFDVKYTNPLNAPATVVVYEPGVTLKLAATMRFGG
ncbi:hypothetical protein BQ8794_120030 [Mesorhizobium prunaredense]|uniref:Uncharacterized protein n=1 Tax=Mesorhizobium prunaredense TaxID=1631249 RepID=A0A1R3V0T9_9HYPH|nr:hypothetical protein BQ8794_120030 [Mesorhizobium prunaredense]